MFLHHHHHHYYHHTTDIEVEVEVDMDMDEITIVRETVPIRVVSRPALPCTALRARLLGYGY